MKRKEFMHGSGERKEGREERHERKSDHEQEGKERGRD